MPDGRAHAHQRVLRPCGARREFLRRKQMLVAGLAGQARGKVQQQVGEANNAAKDAANTVALCMAQP